MKKIAFLSGVAVAALGYAAPVFAQDEDQNDGAAVAVDLSSAILVSASPTGSATQLTARDLDRRQTRDIADVLRDVPGVAVSSIPGQTQIRVRGSEANHVLVLVDGIEVSDPGSGEFDLGALQAEIGSRVTVVRGPRSSVYGNDALAGVVAYDTSSGSELGGFAAFLEAGTNNTVNGAARIGGSGARWDAALSTTIVSTDGEPNARAIGGNGIRDIGRDNYTVSGKGSLDLADSLTVRAVARYVLSEGQSNDQDFTFGSPTLGLVTDSPGVEFENEAIYALVGAELQMLDGSLTHDLSAQIADSNRNTTGPVGITSDSESDRFKASYVSTYNFGMSDHALAFAAEYEVEGFNNVATFDDRNSVENVGFAAEYAYSGDRFDFTAALRHDINDRFEDATTFRAGAGFRVTDTTRLRAAAGTGVKNPTLNELFGFFDGVFVGNPDLQPERSTSWELGVDQGVNAGPVSATLSATYFSAELEDEIFTVFPAPNFIQTPGNRDTVSTRKGIEVALRGEIVGSGFSFDLAYSFLDAEENGAEEVRRPDHIASAVLNWESRSEVFSANLAVRYNGGAVDSDFTTGIFPAPLSFLDEYTLVNFNARVKLAEGIKAFGRVENLLDETYEQVFSFVSPGRTALIGIEARF